MQEVNYESELRSQQSYVFTYKAANVAAFAVFALIGWNANATAFFILAMGQVVFNLLRWPKIAAELAKRQKTVAFKQQIHNLYIFSKHPNDPTVSATFKDAVEMLKTVGNKQEVKVHKVVFQDVCIYTAWTDANSRQVNERAWRPTGSGSETWDEYTEFCRLFVMADIDKRKRELRGKEVGTEHTDKYIFNQQ